MYELNDDLAKRDTMALRKHMIKFDGNFEKCWTNRGSLRVYISKKITRASKIYMYTLTRSIR